MHFSHIFSTSIILAGCAYAQTPLGPASSSTSASATSTSSAAAGAMTTVHVVQVSDATGKLTYSPNSVQANVGDMVQWQYYMGNHSVAMASFSQPCVPVQQSDPSNAQNAFWSGFMPVTNAADNGRLTYTVMIKDTNPVWYYCSQGKHCQDGMVGVINPPQGNSQQTIQTFAAAAAKAANNITPGGSTSGGTASSGAPGTSTTGAAGASSSGNAAPGLVDHAKQGFLGMSFAAAVAFLML